MKIINKRKGLYYKDYLILGFLGVHITYIVPGMRKHKFSIRTGTFGDGFSTKKFDRWVIVHYKDRRLLIEF